MLTAPTKASGQNSVGYDVYDLYDLGEFDQKGGVRTNWGTKEELIAAIKKAKDAGIVSYVDAVLNHRFVFSCQFFSNSPYASSYRFGADRAERFAAVEVDNSDRTKEVSDLYDIEVCLCCAHLRALTYDFTR